jgi:hypothetical protein
MKQCKHCKMPLTDKNNNGDGQCVKCARIPEAKK